MKRVYIGDVGEIIHPQSPLTLPIGTQLDKMTMRELFNLGISLGLPAKQLIGVSTCWDHEERYTKLGGNKLPDGYNWAEHVVYCNNCWEYFRLKRIDQ